MRGFVALLEPSLELPGPPHRSQKRAYEPHVHVPEAPGRATRACYLQGIARTSHFHGTRLREVCRGNSGDKFDGPMTLPHAICEGLWPSPNPPWNFRGLPVGVRSAPVSLMSTSQRPWGGTRTSHFRGTRLREVCRGNSDDDFGGPITLPHAICEGLQRPMALPHASYEGSWPPRAPDLDCYRVGRVPPIIGPSPPPLQNARRRSTAEGVRGRNYLPRLVTPQGGRRTICQVALGVPASQDADGVLRQAALWKGL